MLKHPFYVKDPQAVHVLRQRLNKDWGMEVGVVGDVPARVWREAVECGGCGGAWVWQARNVNKGRGGGRKS